MSCVRTSDVVTQLFFRTESYAVLVTCRNIWTDRSGNIADRHGLKPDSSGTGNNSIKQAFAAEQDILHAWNRLDIHIAGCLHGGQMSGINNNLLARLQIVFDYMSVKFCKDDALPADPLHDKSLSSKQARTYFLAEMYGERNPCFAGKEGFLLEDHVIAGGDMECPDGAGEAGGKCDHSGTVFGSVNILEHFFAGKCTAHCFAKTAVTGGLHLHIRGHLGHSSALSDHFLAGFQVADYDW